MLKRCWAAADATVTDIMGLLVKLNVTSIDDVLHVCQADR